MQPAGRKGNRQPHQPPYPSAAQVLAYAVAECSAPCSLRFRQLAPAARTMPRPIVPRTTRPPCPPLANCGAMPSDLRSPSRPTPIGPLKNACNAGCTAGSVAITSPAIQPSRPAPAHTKAGSRVSKAMISAAPATIRGTLMASPMTSSGMLPLAAAATAMTLSRLITMSAIATICTAAHRCAAASTPLSSSCSGTSSFAAITSSANPPTSLRYGSPINVTTIPVKMMRRKTATPAPRTMPQNRWRGGKPRHAIAMTSALSPDSRMLTHMILPSATQKAGCWISVWNWVKNAEIVAGSKICHSQFTAFLPRALQPLRAAIACRLPNQSADDFVAGKELRDFDRGGLRCVRTVHRVLANRLGMNLADRAVRRLRRIGRAHHVAIFEYGALAFQHLHHDRARGHEVDQFTEERTRLVNGVEGFRLFAGHANAFLGHDPQPRLLDQRVDGAGQIALGRVRFDDRESAFNRHCLRPCKTLVGELRGLYRRHLTTASDRVTRQPSLFGVFSCRGRARGGEDYSNFTQVNPV